MDWKKSAKRYRRSTHMRLKFFLKEHSYFLKNVPPFSPDIYEALCNEVIKCFQKSLIISFYQSILLYFFLFSGSVLKEFSILNHNKTRNVKITLYFYRKRQNFHQKILHLDNSGFWKHMMSKLYFFKHFFHPLLRRKVERKKI